MTGRVVTDYTLVLTLIVARRYRRLRKERKVTQKEVARRVGSHGPIIARFESGKHCPSLAFLERIAAAIGLRCVDIIRAVDSPIEWNMAEERLEQSKLEKVFRHEPVTTSTTRRG